MTRRGFLVRVLGAVGAWLIAPLRSLFAQETPPPPSEAKGRPVVIVGGGLAGLAAAHELAVRRKGEFAVTVLEASAERTGGRVDTYRGFPGGVHVEAAAEFFEGIDRYAIAAIRELGLELVEAPGDDWVFLKGARGPWRSTFVEAVRSLPSIAPKAKDELAPGGKLDKTLAAAVDTIQDVPWESDEEGRALDKITFQKWLRQKDFDPDVETAVNAWFEDEYAASIAEVSALYGIDETWDVLYERPRQEAEEGGEKQRQGDEGATLPGGWYQLAGGNDTLPKALVARIEAAGGVVHLGARATGVDWGGAAAAGVRVHVHVKPEKGAPKGLPKTFEADAAVLACPAFAATKLRFRPELPDEKAAALAGARYGSYAKVLLQLDEPVWERHGTGAAPAVTTDTIAGTVNVVRRPASPGEGYRPTVSVLVSGADAARNGGDVDVDAVIAALDRIWPGAKAAARKDSAKVFAYAGRALPYLGPGDATGSLRFTGTPAGDRLFFAGDYVNCGAGKNAAIRSGEKAARALARALEAAGAGKRAPAGAGK